MYSWFIKQEIWLRTPLYSLQWTFDNSKKSAVTIQGKPPRLPLYKRDCCDFHTIQQRTIWWQRYSKICVRSQPPVQKNSQIEYMCFCTYIKLPWFKHSAFFNVTFSQAMCQMNHTDFPLDKLSMTELGRAGQITLTDWEESFTDYLLDLPSLARSI